MTEQVRHLAETQSTLSTVDSPKPQDFVILATVCFLRVPICGHGRPLSPYLGPHPQRRLATSGVAWEYFYPVLFSVFPNKGRAPSLLPSFLDPGTTTSGLLLLVLRPESPVDGILGIQAREDPGWGDYTAPAACGISDCRDQEARKDRGGVLALVLWQKSHWSRTEAMEPPKQFCLRPMVKTPFLVLQMFTSSGPPNQDFLQRTYHNDLLTHNHPVTQTGSKGIVCDQESSNQRTHMETCLSFLASP